VPASRAAFRDVGGASRVRARRPHARALAVIQRAFDSCRTGADPTYEHTREKEILMYAPERWMLRLVMFVFLAMFLLLAIGHVPTGG
jgi:hypothetical protein